MSDDEEFEYEYDDDDDQGNDDDDEGQFDYTDEEEEQDDSQVALENAYYNAKGLRDTDREEAVTAFEQVIEQELAGNNNKYGPWSYKSMKQLVKMALRSSNADSGVILKYYTMLLQCISSGNISPNQVEKGIQGMLERVASLYQSGAAGSTMANAQTLALAIYDATLTVFHPETGQFKNERLWFKTNLKYGQLLYEMNETSKLQLVLKDLMNAQQQQQLQLSNNNSGASTQSMEIYALQIQLYSRQKDTKKLRETFHKAMNVRGGIPHPRTLALIQELGGKMHMASKEYEEAGKTFFQAFKSYDEAGDPNRLRCLKYLVLASMLHASTINPFDSQEARPYRDDPEIVAMTNLVQAFHNNEIQSFERILKQNQGRIMEDEFVREHVEDLLRTIRTQVLRRVIQPYKRISIQAIARELNDIPIQDVESLLVGLILDGTLDGKIDRVDGVLLIKQAKSSNHQHQYQQQQSLGEQQQQYHPQQQLQQQAGLGGSVVSRGSMGTNATIQKCEAMDHLIHMLEHVASQCTSVKTNELPSMAGGFVH